MPHSVVSALMSTEHRYCNLTHNSENNTSPTLGEFRNMLYTVDILTPANTMVSTFADDTAITTVYTIIMTLP